jgi:hypothetical protein
MTRASETRSTKDERAETMNATNTKNYRMDRTQQECRFVVVGNLDFPVSSYLRMVAGVMATESVEPTTAANMVTNTCLCCESEQGIRNSELYLRRYV